MTAPRPRCRRTLDRPPARRCAEQEAVVRAYLEALDAGDDPCAILVLTPTGRSSLEGVFVAVAAEYAQRRRISAEAWQAVGVPADVLATARISSGSAPPPSPSPG